MGDWDEVVALGEQAFASGDYPDDPDLKPYLSEGYAHQSDWEIAVELSQSSYQSIKEICGSALVQALGTDRS